MNMAEMRRLLAIADDVAWWPAVLRRASLGNAPEQAACANALEDHGLAWCAAVRAATDAVLSRIAWDSIRRTDHTDDELAATPDSGLVLRVNGRDIRAFAFTCNS
jgi:hypothetical protein